MKKKIIVFTDLDGTLLDYHTYSFEASSEGIELLRRFDIPIIFCTSKSYAEVIHFREKTHNAAPFIVENGGAIYIPANYFKHMEQFKRFEDYVVVELGGDYNEIRKVFEQMKKEFKNKLSGFGDMSVEDIASYLNLPSDLASLAKIRMHDEPFILKDDSLLEAIKQFADRHGLKISAGTRFHHLMGNTDKGVAVKKLISMYREAWGDVTTAGIGEGKNDEPMFGEVDMPYLVKKPNGAYIDLSADHVVKIDGIGPEGFTLSVRDFLKRENISDER